MVVRKESTYKQQKCKTKPDLVKNCAINFRVLKIKSFRHYQIDYIEEWVENFCDGGLLIAENFYVRKEELDQQSLNCVARNKCLLKMHDGDTQIEQSL